MAAPARPANVNWQQPEEPIVPIGATSLVLPSHEWPAQVAYCHSRDIRIFWDLAYLSESFHQLIGLSSDWFSAKSLQKRFKELALSFDLSDHLHLRGLQDRLGLGSRLGMVDSIKYCGGGPIKKILYIYDCFSLQKSNDPEIVLMELHH